MSIQFQCPECGKILAVDDEHAGQQAKCPHCGFVSFVPEISRALDSTGTVETGAAGGSSLGVPPQAILEPIDSHLVDAILITICCCLPFGIVGIIYAAMCKSQMNVGNYALAREYSRKAFMWNMIGLGVGICWAILLIIFNMLGAGLGI